MRPKLKDSHSLTSLMHRRFSTVKPPQANNPFVKNFERLTDNYVSILE